jgi:hypothetical protein
MTDGEHGRRRFLRGTGSVAAIGALTGRIGGNAGTGSTGEESTATGTQAETTTERAVQVDAATETTTAESGGGEGDSTFYIQPAPRAVDQWLLDQNPFYDGNMVVGIPYVGVGAGENDTDFDPAAVKISTGTEITWEWASGAKPHTVESIA